MGVGMIFCMRALAIAAGLLLCLAVVETAARRPPPAAPPTRPPARLPPGCPKGPTGLECNGQGTCVTKTVGGTQFKKCQCTSGTPPACLDNSQDFDLGQKRNRTAEADRDRQKFEKDRKQLCGTRGFMCPQQSWVDSSKKGTCVSSLTKCTTSNPIVLIRNLTASCTADATKHYCPDIGCVPKGTVCAPSPPCVVGKKRCIDGSCVDRTATCPAAPACPSSGGQVNCPGGTECKATLRECAISKPWNGCPNGKVECASKPGTCVTDIATCQTATGCPVGKVFCGFERNPSGQIKKVNGNDVAKCGTQAQCKQIGRKPKSVTQRMNMRNGGTINIPSVDSNGTEHSASMVRLVFPATSSGAATSDLVVSPVADSVVRNGPFKSFNDNSRLRSALISVEPSSVIDVSSGNAQMSIVVDDSDLTTMSRCAAAMNNMAAYSVSDVQNTTVSPEVMSACQGQLVDNQCACKFVLSHFSTYGVVEDASKSDTPSSPPSTSSGTSDDASRPQSVVFVLMLLLATAAVALNC